MADRFHTSIRKSLADANLQAALTANAQRRIQVRKNAFTSLPDPQALRARAHAVRADVIDHLDGYLEQFIQNAQENGLVVHRAVDAEQAVNTVLEIARKNGANLVAKSKTMLGEEIELNLGLQKNGLEVVETDLGEYIVQLRGEPPSHIITPAVHLRRQDVGRLFEEKLGVPYTDDISIMTNVARKTLRQVFLNADIGISGVNFGVAETGTLCLVTNEGNGRMVTTVPPVHIALMGIERLVPTLDDLALMLSLLPRSATGQKLSAYTSLVNSPRRAGDPDGPRERHVVLVDNGRRATRASGLREILYCIRCGACLNACPVFREIGGHAYVSQDGKITPYPGPMGSVVSPALFGHLEFSHLARASSLCGACREACPVDIDLPALLLRIRSGVQVDQPGKEAVANTPVALDMGLKVFTTAAASPWRFTIAQKMAGIFGTLAASFSGGGPWIKLPNVSGWGYSKDFPRPSLKPFRSSYHRQIRPADDEVWWRSSKTEAEDKSIHLQTSSQREPDKLGQFTSELKNLGGHIYPCSSGMVGEIVLKILDEKDVTELLLWDESYLPPGLMKHLSAAGIHMVHPVSESVEACSQVRVGLTGVFAGLADTGSLVLLGGMGRPLTASLLPEIHIAILYKDDIYENLRDVIYRKEVKRASAVVVISGPSRTSDIEMTLTVGVHGPGELHVICIED